MPHIVDRLEKLGRLVLWLAISSVFVALPLAYAKQHEAEQRAVEALRKDAEKAAEAAASKQKTIRLPLDSVGPAIRALNQTTARGSVWFTNLSALSGVVCLEGTATNPNTGESTTSLATCRRVEEYESLIEVNLMFAGGELFSLCPREVKCSMKVTDAAAR